MKIVTAGLTRADIDRAPENDFGPAPRLLRPRDAATLILIDRAGPAPRVLMGRRHAGHAFMAGKFVFPGGRTDPHDSRLSGIAPLAPDDEARLMRAAGSRASPTRARAIALSAVRETYEEAGMLIGEAGAFATGNPHWREFAERGVRPSLAGLRFIARAVTPPGRVRRFDTRFFAAFADAIAVSLPDGGPTRELEALEWLTFGQANDADLPAITRTILGDLQARLATDPALAENRDVPFYRMVNGRFRRDLL